MRRHFAAPFLAADDKNPTLYLVSAAMAYDEDAALAVSRFVLCRRRRRRRRRPPRLTGSVNVGCAGGSGSPSSSFTDVAVAPCY